MSVDITIGQLIKEKIKKHTMNNKSVQNLDFPIPNIMANFITFHWVI